MPVSTSLSQHPAPSTDQSALIAVTAGCAILLVFTIFAAIFFRRRNLQRRKELTDSLANEERRKSEGAVEVDVLDSDDSLRGNRITRPRVEYPGSSLEYHLSLAPTQQPCLHHPNVALPPPALHPPRSSDSGSAFREEGMFGDPLLHFSAPNEDLTFTATNVVGPVASPDIINPQSAPYRPLSSSRRASCSTMCVLSVPTPKRSGSSSPALQHFNSTSFSSSVSSSSEELSWPPTPSTILPVDGSSAPKSASWHRLGGSTAPISLHELHGPSIKSAPLLGIGVNKTHSQHQTSPLRRPATADEVYVLGHVSRMVQPAPERDAHALPATNWLDRTPRRLERPQTADAYTPDAHQRKPRARSVGR